MYNQNQYGSTKRHHPKRRVYNSDFNVVAIRLANKLDKFGYSMLPVDLVKLMVCTLESRPDPLRMRMLLSINRKRPFRLGMKGTIT